MSDSVMKYKAGSIFKDQEGTDVDILQQQLDSLPPSMVMFSSSLRKLYATAKVTDQTKETRNFLAVRDSVRQNGIVYITKVLPMTEEVIRAIGFFSDYFTDLEFDDWSDCLDDIIGDVEKANEVCTILKQYHNSIIKDLMKNEDKANVSLTELTKMKEQYKVQEQKLMEQAQAHKKEAAKERDYSMWGAVFSFGISAAVSNKWADEAEAKAKHEHLEAIGKRENADIAFAAVLLVEGQLIPAVNTFIEGLNVCAMFLSDTKERLLKMKEAGDKGKKKPYYKMMRNRAKELNATCLRFLAVTDLMRNHMGAIPSDTGDMNHVDKWLKEQHEEFAREKPHIWSRIKSEVFRISNLAPGWKNVN